MYFSKKKRVVVYGKWTECVYSIETKVYEANKKAEKKSGGDSKKHKQVVSTSRLSLTVKPLFIFCSLFIWKSNMHPQMKFLRWPQWSENRFSDFMIIVTKSYTKMKRSQYLFSLKGNCLFYGHQISLKTRQNGKRVWERFLNKAEI